MMSKDISFETECGKLCFHAQSLHGRVQDYIITFHDFVGDIGLVCGRSLDLFRRLIEHFQDFTIKARLIAQVRFIRFDEGLEPAEKVDYHFTSYSQEEVVEAKEFFHRHMNKIVSRLDEFNIHGSRLVIDYIPRLHIALTLIPKS